MAKKIFIIDDEADMITLLKTRLEAHGFEIETAFDGEEGLEKLKDVLPDLIILDIMMPKMDGFSFVRELKQDERLKTIPVLVLTAKTMMDDLFKMEGINDYIIKPYDPAKLLEKIQTYFE